MAELRINGLVEAFAKEVPDKAKEISVRLFGRESICFEVRVADWLWSYTAYRSEISRFQGDLIPILGEKCREYFESVDGLESPRERPPLASPTAPVFD